MSKLYFLETNGGWITAATNEDGRACFMWQDGREENYPSDAPDWNEANAEKREQIAMRWLRSVADWNSFDELYTNCDSIGGFSGVYTVQDLASDIEQGGCRIIACTDF